jgi:hypothetical protein
MVTMGAERNRKNILFLDPHALNLREIRPSQVEEILPFSKQMVSKKFLGMTLFYETFQDIISNFVASGTDAGP